MFIIRGIFGYLFFALNHVFYYTFMLFAFECGTKMMTQFVIDNGGIMGQFIKAGKVNDVMTNSGISKVKDDDKSLYRVESIYEGSSNYSLVNDVPTV